MVLTAEDLAIAKQCIAQLEAAKAPEDRNQQERIDAAVARSLLAERAPALVAEVERLRAVLDDLVYSEPTCSMGGGDVCLYCGSEQEIPQAQRVRPNWNLIHAADCPVAHAHALLQG